MEHSWQNLLVWQQSHALVLSIYKLSATFPEHEHYAVCDQLKRAAYSVPSNIVEGHSKQSRKEFKRYLYIARGSLEELRYFLLLSKDLAYLSEALYNKTEEHIRSVSYLLNRLINSLE
jgi:four helix bundle protein